MISPRRRSSAAVNHRPTTAELAEQYPAHFTFRVVHHTAVIIKHHRLASRRVAGRPLQSGLARITRAREIGPGRAHCLAQLLRLRRVASTLFAAFRVIEAEGELG